MIMNNFVLFIAPSIVRNLTVALSHLSTHYRDGRRKLHYTAQWIVSLKIFINTLYMNVLFINVLYIYLNVNPLFINMLNLVCLLYIISIKILSIVFEAIVFTDMR